MATPEPTNLPDDPELLKEMIRELLEKLEKSRRLEEQMRHKVDELLRKLFGRSSEWVDPNQLTLIDLASFGLAPPPIEEPPPKSPPRWRGHGRRRLPENLPRRDVRCDVDEAVCPCCGLPMIVIREEVSEQLDYEPASFFVNRYIRPVYVCGQGCDETVTLAAKPPQPIEKGLPGAGLLAHVMVSKYCDHQPLHRLETIFDRQGVFVSRKTMCGWVAAVNDRVTPIVELLHEDVLKSYVLGTDDTPVPVRTPSGPSKGRLWVYVGDNDHPSIVFDYTPTRERDGPERFLGKYSGYLQADAYSGYDRIYADGSVIEVACWMHARRYFFEASQIDPVRPLEALAFIKRLYQIERACAQLSVDERRASRQERSVPVLDAFATWRQEQELITPPKSPLGRALTYTRNQWTALQRFAQDGRLPIDNGRTERALRGIALGRRNWLFAGSHEGGVRAAGLYSLISTCRRHEIEPYSYLKDLLQRLPTHPSDRLHELTPTTWAAQLAQTT